MADLNNELDLNVPAAPDLSRNLIGSYSYIEMERKISHG